MNWRSAAVAGLIDRLVPALPRRAVIAAVAADDGGYAVKLSDDCPLDGRFEVGSIAKTFTGIVLASLVCDGAVSLDDEIGGWLDAGQNSAITLGQLATHTSGLPRLPPGHTTGVADPYAFLTASAAERELRLIPSRPRGVEWDYSNFGFQVLGLALERATGIAFGVLVERRVFGPLGMTCSGAAGRGRGCRIQGHAQGSPVRPWTHHLWGAGGAEASAEDMARYLSACLTPPQSAVGRAIRLASEPHHRIDPLRSAGLGWAVGPPGYLGHDGGTSGFRAMLGIRAPACRAAGVFVSDRTVTGLPQAVRHSLGHEPGSSLSAQRSDRPGRYAARGHIGAGETAMQIHDSLIELVGNTPLVRLRHVTRDLPGGGERPIVAAKVEYFNPGGSVKDRIALRMVEAAERSGALRPGGTIVEPTSGNTGVGLAIVAAEKGYRCVFVCPDKVGQDKLSVLRAYGAEVVVCPTVVSPEHPDSYYSVSDRLAAEIPDAWKPDQYQNPENPASHYHSTGPEIWAQTEGRVTHFVAGIGTGGTISGAGRYLKDVSAGRVKVIGADPEGSVYSGGSGRPYLIEGVGEDIWPATFDRDVTDEVIAVSDAESFLMTRRLAREEALLTGGSCGLAVVVALRVAARAEPDDVVVALLPDGGRGYLAKIFNDEWMADYGFLNTALTEPTAADVLASKQHGLPEFVHTHPTETVGTVIGIMREYDVSQVPVIKEEPPVMVAEVIGSIIERDLLDALVAGRARRDDPVGGLMSDPLPMVGSGEAVSSVVAALEKAGAALVLMDGKPAGMITRQDLLAFMAD